MPVRDKHVCETMYYYYYTVTLQISFSFEIFSKKLEGNTKRKKLQKGIFLQIREGRIKTAALPSVHFSYQEETQGKIDDGVQCVAENLGISCI